MCQSFIFVQIDKKRYFSLKFQMGSRQTPPFARVKNPIRSEAGIRSHEGQHVAAVQRVRAQGKLCPLSQSGSTGSDPHEYRRLRLRVPQSERAEGFDPLLLQSLLDAVAAMAHVLLRVDHGRRRTHFQCGGNVLLQIC